MPVAVGEGFRGRDGRLGYLLRQAHQAMRTAMERELRDLEITASQYSLMSVLGAQPELTVTELASDSMLTQQTTSEIIRVLLREGLVQSEPDATDRRARRITLTGRGAAVLREADERVRLLEEDALAGLSDDDRHSVVHWLVACAEHFSERRPAPPLG
ncbi:MAG TPA: MarR family transcriptional regulator [Conexibacter sp.]